MKTLNQTLKNLNVSLLPPKKVVARTFKVLDLKNEVYYGAEIFEDRDFALEYIGEFYSLTEEDLKNDLKKSYNIDYLKERSFKNFIKWFQKISNKKLTDLEIFSLSKKFDF